MPEIILHHYELSTFSEKIRVAMGLKGLAWRSVDIPAAPPRPLLAPLTGGYRRVPVLQVGADIYCDTNLIMPTLERLFPSPQSPSLYPAGCEGLARGLSFAWDRAMWIPTIGVLSHFIGDMFPPEFVKDRQEGYLGIDISKAAMAPELPLHRLAQMRVGGRPALCFRRCTKRAGPDVLPDDGAAAQELSARGGCNGWLGAAAALVRPRDGAGSWAARSHDRATGVRRGPRGPTTGTGLSRCRISSRRFACRLPGVRDP